MHEHAQHKKRMHEHNIKIKCLGHTFKDLNLSANKLIKNNSEIIFLRDSTNIF